MMHARTMMLTALGGGTLMGLALGVTTNTAMLPSPEPSWRQAVPVHPSSPASYQLVDSGPQDLSPTWYLDRMPTWKRRALERAGYTIDDLGYPVPPEPLPAAYEPPPDAEQPPEPTPLAIEPRSPAPLDAAEAELAAHQAEDAVAPEALPAVQEPAPVELSVVTSPEVRTGA